MYKISGWRARKSCNPKLNKKHFYLIICIYTYNIPFFLYTFFFKWKIHSSNPPLSPPLYKTCRGSLRISFITCFSIMLYVRYALSLSPSSLSSLTFSLFVTLHTSSLSLKFVSPRWFSTNTWYYSFLLCFM